MNDEQLKRLLKDKRSRDNYKEELANDVKLWTTKRKVFVPNPGRKDLIIWCYECLQRCGQEQTASTIRQHFDLPVAVEDANRYVKKCDTYQKYKITGVKKYGKVSIIEDSLMVPSFSTVHLDIIGPWTIRLL